MWVEPKVGMILYGHCEGILGRSHHGQSRIETVAYDYFVAREIPSGVIHIAVADKLNDAIKIRTEWLEDDQGW
jgi:hypothetical protein